MNLGRCRATAPSWHAPFITLLHLACPEGLPWEARMSLKAIESSDFWPPHCPNPECAQASSAQKAGFFRHGHYTTRMHGRRVPRFLCRVCRRTMSSQTFDSTYRLRRPELEHAIIKEIAQGSSLRRVAQVLGINRKTVSRRLFRARRQVAVTTEAEARAIQEKSVTKIG